jgi:hypothetical protein
MGYLVLGWLGLGVLLTAPSARADDKETREFTVRIDGKPAGHYTMTINRQDDGTVIMAGEADIKVSYLFVSYKYKYSGTEVWKEGNLLQLKSTCNDDGKKYAVTATLEGMGLRVWINGKDHMTSADVWTTSFWRAPDPHFYNQETPLLDADTGRDLTGTLKVLDPQGVHVAGAMQHCTHYKLTGAKLQEELWYDAQGRLARRVFVEDGHTTVLELAQVRH